MLNHTIISSFELLLALEFPQKLISDISGKNKNFLLQI